MCRTAALLALLVVAGCAGARPMYDGTRRPPTEVAVVRSGLLRQGLTTTAFYPRAVNHRTTLSFADQLLTGVLLKYPDLELLPGRHTIAVALRGQSAFTDTYSILDCVIPLDVEAGHTYVIEGNIRETTWHAWARDEATNRVTECSFPGVPRGDGTASGGWVPPCPSELVRVVETPDIALVTLENYGTVRLAGVTPESGIPGATHDPFNISGQCVRVEAGRVTRDYNTPDPGARVGSYVYLGDDSFLNLLLIEGGYASTDGSVPRRLRPRFDAAQQAAQATSRGRWTAAPAP